MVGLWVGWGGGVVGLVFFFVFWFCLGFSFFSLWVVVVGSRGRRGVAEFRFRRTALIDLLYLC